ncbi:MAG TPA: DUF72 domain-containing protein [Gemmatimonadaceae bacterium]|nr:DUF72 domain-containing protein [Gemmatimonadaceae bacterium]
MTSSNEMRDASHARDASHDPGPATAAARAEHVTRAAVAPVITPSSMVRFGTAGWTDRTLTAPGVFYPPNATSAEARLRYYATRFSIVEVDATYYALPSRQMAMLWAQRSPDDFVFDVKAHALMTGQPSEVARLPADVRAALPATLASKPRIYTKDLPPELQDAIWTIFLDALEPLRRAGKMGSILLQYPRWFGPGRTSRELIRDARDRLGSWTGAVELRNARWFTAADRDRTLSLLAELELPFVMVDAPQGTGSSVPPIVAVTAPSLAVVRFHGRRVETWEAPGVGVAERFRYLYDRDELEEWVPRLREVAREARNVHVIMNNCYANYGTTNAAELAALFGAAYASS